VDHIEADQQGDMQARSIDGYMLQTVDLFHIHQPQNRTHLSFCDGVVGNFLDKALKRNSRGLVQLACFFVDRHLLEKRVSTLADTFGA